MYVSKHSPKCLTDIVGHYSSLKEIEGWLANWKTGESLLLSGPSGVGKTAIVLALAKEKKLEIFELNAGDVRSSDEIKKMLGTASKQRSLFFKGRLILIDEIDSMSREDAGGINEIAAIIKESKFPIILTAINAYDQKIKTLRAISKIITLKKLNSTSILGKLIDVCKKENLNINSKILKEISEKSNGDMRSALIDLQTVTCGKISSPEDIGFRERDIGIFDVMAKIFKSRDYSEAIKAISYCDKDVDEIFWWVEENIPVEFKNTEDIAAAFNMLSKADIFRERVFKNQNFRYKKYMADMLASMSLIRKSNPSSFTAYRYPSTMLMLSKSKTKRVDLDKRSEELAAKLHCSKKNVKEQMPYLGSILSKQ